MATTKLLFLKNFFLKFNTSYLSNELESRLKTKKSFGQILYFTKKHILFFVLSFSLFCFLLFKAPFFLQNFWADLASDTKFLDTSIKFGLGFLCFFAVGYLTAQLQSILMRNFDFLFARIQIASRYLMHSSVQYQYEKKQTTDFLKFIFGALSIAPICVLFYVLSTYLHSFFLVPVGLFLTSTVFVGFLKLRSEKLFYKTEACYQTDVKFFKMIEQYLTRIRQLSFDAILQKKIIGFSGDSAPFYQKIFENEILVTGIKYFSVFLLFSANAGLYLLTIKEYTFANFLPILTISGFLSYYYLSFLSIFDYKLGATAIYNYLKKLDNLRFSEQSNDASKSHEDEHEDIVVSFKNASFVKDNQVVFHKMTHEIQKNNMSCLVGSSPEERTNYLNACVGNLYQVGGHLKTPQKFEFLSKDTVLFDGSIRENIVQSYDFNPDYYREVLRACALTHEIELLSDGDLTLVHHKEHHFTESFVRKLAIARIVYAKSEVNFFDEPFVDIVPHDAAQIFCEAFQKLLNGTTRILATDKVEFAALSDDILVCKSGKIIEQGSHVSLLSYDSLYSRLFYAGAENKRYEVLQNHIKFEHIAPISPIKPNYQQEQDDTADQADFVFGDHLFEKFKKKADKLSHFTKMFFPVFVSKNFYAFFTFLTIAVWGALYAFYFVFSNLTLNIVAKTSILFFAFSLIACISFSVMIIFYKNVYATCAYIIENMSRVYFAKRLAHQSNSYNLDWENEHILSVTGKFFKNLLNFLLIGIFALGVVLLLSTLSLKFLTIGLLGICVGLLFIHAIIRNQFFFDTERSAQLNNKFVELTQHFFAAYNTTQSQNVRTHLLEKTHAKIYSCYQTENAELSKTSIFSNTFGLRELLLNYRVIANMILHVRTDYTSIKVKPMSYVWPSNGVIELENVKFISEAESACTFTIPAQTKFLYTEDASFVEKSVFIEKLRAYSPLCKGSIKIDNEDISQISSEIVLKRIGYISQTSYVPFLTIAQHIDPYGLSDPSEIWEVLAKVGIAQQVALLKNGLDTTLDALPEEMHWSGEVVMFSFARCIINHNKLICIDHIEVSEEVENQIVQLIKTEFSKCTVIFATDNEKFKSLCNMLYPTLNLGQNVGSVLPDQELGSDLLWRS